MDDGRSLLRNFRGYKECASVRRESIRLPPYNSEPNAPHYREKPEKRERAIVVVPENVYLRAARGVTEENEMRALEFAPAELLYLDGDRRQFMDTDPNKRCIVHILIVSYSHFKSRFCR